jgi:hypothetical protein
MPAVSMTDGNLALAQLREVGPPAASKLGSDAFAERLRFRRYFEGIASAG